VSHFWSQQVLFFKKFIVTIKRAFFFLHCLCPLLNGLIDWAISILTARHLRLFFQQRMKIKKKTLYSWGLSWFEEKKYKGLSFAAFFMTRHLLGYSFFSSWRRVCVPPYISMRTKSPSAWRCRTLKKGERQYMAHFEHFFFGHSDEHVSLRFHIFCFLLFFFLDIVQLLLSLLKGWLIGMNCFLVNKIKFEFLQQVPIQSISRGISNECEIPSEGPAVCQPLGRSLRSPGVFLSLWSSSKNASLIDSMVSSQCHIPLSFWGFDWP